LLDFIFSQNDENKIEINNEFSIFDKMINPIINSMVGLSADQKEGASSSSDKSLGTGSSSFDKVGKALRTTLSAFRTTRTVLALDREGQQRYKLQSNLRTPEIDNVIYNLRNDLKFRPESTTTTGFGLINGLK
jgi:protoporphyrinogen oxidase